MEGAFLKYIVVCQRPPILQLPPRRNQALYNRRNAFFVLNKRLHGVNRVSGSHCKSNPLSGESCAEDLVVGIQGFWAVNRRKSRRSNRLIRKLPLQCTRKDSQGTSLAQSIQLQVQPTSLEANFSSVPADISLLHVTIGHD